MPIQITDCVVIFCAYAFCFVALGAKAVTICLKRVSHVRALLLLLI